MTTETLHFENARTVQSLIVCVAGQRFAEVQHVESAAATEREVGRKIRHAHVPADADFERLRADLSDLARRFEQFYDDRFDLPKI